MPIRYDQIDSKTFQDGSAVGITPRDIIELVTAFRLYGFFRIDLETGHFFATPDVYTIFGMEYQTGPMNLLEFRDHIHPDDLPLLMTSFERASTHKEIYHNIYRVKRPEGAYRFVRTVGKFREKEGTPGEIVGITYEFFERLRTIAFASEFDEP
ncbi:PAS domain-containing protein [Ciceribacter sp. L1K22]|uniref:PAS domain-containing protein n=1 Tax=Ciceribacter sp. L1K22 TaxID=2820275 RepID=UPI001ABEDF14|nr:PAS domain-containing protein [Ciceribacter sp. L1K22]MBO3761126.1 PAS domain-containing protein [Ciceribacter sp. L1K22]